MKRRAFITLLGGAPQGRSRLPKEWQGLGISDTIEKAKALCERHFAVTARHGK
jgi:hypothetical protein